MVRYAFRRDRRVLLSPAYVEFLHVLLYKWKLSLLSPPAQKLALHVDSLNSSRRFALGAHDVLLGRGKPGI